MELENLVSLINSCVAIVTCRCSNLFIILNFFLVSSTISFKAVYYYDFHDFHYCPPYHLHPDIFFLFAQICSQMLDTSSPSSSSMNQKTCSYLTRLVACAQFVVGQSSSFVCHLLSLTLLLLLFQDVTHFFLPPLFSSSVFAYSLSSLLFPSCFKFYSGFEIRLRVREFPSARPQNRKCLDKEDQKR